MSEVLETTLLESDAWKHGRALVEPLLAASRPVACLIASLDRLERIKEESAHIVLRSALETHLRGMSQLAGATFERQGDLLWILVPGIAAKDCTTLARALVESVRKVRLSDTRWTISVGAAAGRPALRAEVLFKVAEEGLAVARNGGGDRAVHTDLYDLVQKKLTGQGLPAVKPTDHAPPSALRPLERAGTARAPGVALDEVTLTPPGAASAVRGEGEAHDPRDTQSVELLERRIAKLTESLGVTEEELQRVLRMKGVDPGVASVYRSVQGLSADAVQAELKRELMSKIFQANLDLRKQISSSGSGPSSKSPNP